MSFWWAVYTLATIGAWWTPPMIRLRNFCGDDPEGWFVYPIVCCYLGGIGTLGMYALLSIFEEVTRGLQLCGL